MRAGNVQGALWIDMVRPSRGAQQLSDCATHGTPVPNLTERSCPRKSRSNYTCPTQMKCNAGALSKCDQDLTPASNHQDWRHHTCLPINGTWFRFKTPRFSHQRKFPHAQSMEISYRFVTSTGRCRGPFKVRDVIPPGLLRGAGDKVVELSSKSVHDGHHHHCRPCSIYSIVVRRNNSVCVSGKR